MLINSLYVKQIAMMLKSNMSPEDIAAAINENEIESLAADFEDDSDEAYERRYSHISPDDRFDSRGEPLIPVRGNEFHEPLYMW